MRGLSLSKLVVRPRGSAVVEQTFTIHLEIENVCDLAGWQLDLAFNPAVLKVLSVSEGDFLSKDGGTAFFAEGEVDNAAGAVTGLGGATIGKGGASGDGTLVSITFEAKAAGRGWLRLSEDKLGSSGGNRIHYDVEIQPVLVESTYDLNGDGQTNLLDLKLVAQNLGKANPQADANRDGTVNVFDLIAVAQHIDSATQASSDET